jgi:uroporphyrinogen-III synthase
VPKRVLVTRAPHQASALADQLRSHGLDPVLIPTIDIAPPTSYCAIDAALACLPTYHWIVFTSANAVECFFQRAREISPSPHFILPTSCRVAAIGPATARTLESFGIKTDLIPPQAVAESLAVALMPYALQPDGSPTRFLVPRAEDIKNALETHLKAAKAELTIAPVYRNIIPAVSIPAIQQLFSDPANHPSAITFTSSSTATNLLALLEVAGLALPPEIQRISIGPVTSDTLHNLGYPPHAEASTATISSLVEKLVEALEPVSHSLEG